MNLRPKNIYKAILKTLNSPYSFRYEIRTIVWESFAIGLFVFFFLYLFSPLSSPENENTLRNTYEILCFGIVSFIISFITNFTISRISPKKINENNWSVKKEILAILILLILISAGNSFLFYYFEYSEFNSLLIIEAILNTLKIGLFPVIIGIFIEQNRRLRKYVKSANEINRTINNLQKRKSENNKLVLHESNDKYTRVFNNQELCFIKSAGNYVEVYSNKNGIIKPTLLRNSFKNIDSQVTTSGTIIRCHRTYMVNTSMVISVEGNSQGYKLRIKDYEFEIPVSRSYTKDIQERINQMQFE